MSKFTANMQMADTDQMTLPDIDQAKSDVIAALDGADNKPSPEADNAGFNEAFGAITGLSAVIGVAQLISDVVQPQEPQQVAQERSGTEFMTGKKAAPSKYIDRKQADVLVRKAEPIVRAARAPVPLLQAGKRPVPMLGAKAAPAPARKAGRRAAAYDLSERVNIASSSVKSTVKGAALSPEAAAQLKFKLGLLQRAEGSLSVKAAQAAPDDARAKNSLTRFSQDNQLKVAPKAPQMQMEAPKPQVSAPKPPTPTFATA